jgi:hypothetical protein
MSRVLSFKSSTSTIGTLDGTTYLTNPLNMNPNNQKAIRLVQLSIDSDIPNVYNYGGENNGLVRTSKDDGVTWDVIQLSNGVYTVSQIEAAILASITAYWTDPTDPGFTLRANSVTQQCYVIIDSTKLAVADQFRIDFKYLTSLMYELLGFVTTTAFSVDGTYTGSQYPRLDWFGNSIVVNLIGFGYISIYNGSSGYEFARIPLSAAQINNEYIYPLQGIQTPWIIIDNLSYLQKFTIELKGDYNNKSIYCLEGAFALTFEIKEL